MIESLTVLLFLNIDANAEELPLCDPQQYVSRIEPDMQYDESDFTFEEFQSAISWFREATWRTQIEGKTHDTPLSLGWEFDMSYYNRLTKIQGYTLKQRALAADPNDDGEAIRDFCNFVINSFPLD